MLNPGVWTFEGQAVSCGRSGGCGRTLPGLGLMSPGEQMDEHTGDNERPARKRGRGPTPSAEVGKLFDRLPPHSPEAEMALLGSMLLDTAVIPQVLDWVKGPEAFYNEAHGAIYRAIVELYDRHASLDLVQAVERLRDQQVLDRIGGPDYLVELAEGVPSAVNAPHFARIVAEKHRLRSLINAAGEMLYEAYHAGELGPDGVRTVLDSAQTALFNLADDPGQNDAQSLAELLFEEQERLEHMDGKDVTGLATGFMDLDKLTSGLQPGEMFILAARPSMGKTALALNLAEQVAMGGDAFASPGSKRVPVAVFSLEMSKNALTQRLLSARSGVDLQRIRSGQIGGDWQAINRACGELHDTPIIIDDTPGLTILQLRARARRLAQQFGIKCIIIDYLQLLTSPGAARESRQVEVSTISRGIKALAREMSMPVICLAQLNRGTEQREGNRPRMSDLRESGSIEQDADVVALLHREEYYHRNDPDWAEENPDKVGLAELILAKQRNGPTGIVKLTWDTATTRFKNHDPFHSDADIGGGHHDPFAEPKPRITPDRPPPARPASRQSFAPGKKTGPVSDFRDGGGPDVDGYEDESSYADPWDDSEPPPPLPSPDQFDDDEPPF